MATHKQRELIFMDTEFTGLRQDTKLISIALIHESGTSFYAEFDDFDWNKIDDWLQTNVIANTAFLRAWSSRNRRHVFGSDPLEWYQDELNNISMFAGTECVKQALVAWLEQFGAVTIVSDTLAWDWVLFTELFGGPFNMPKNIFYIPIDIATMFELIEGDSDINRADYVEYPSPSVQHNALVDATIIKACYTKLKIRLADCLRGAIVKPIDLDTQRKQVDMKVLMPGLDEDIHDRLHGLAESPLPHQHEYRTKLTFTSIGDAIQSNVNFDDLTTEQLDELIRNTYQDLYPVLKDSSSSITTSLRQYLAKYIRLTMGYAHNRSPSLDKSSSSDFICGIKTDGMRWESPTAGIHDRDEVDDLGIDDDLLGR